MTTPPVKGRSTPLNSYHLTPTAGENLARKSTLLENVSNRPQLASNPPATLSSKTSSGNMESLIPPADADKASASPKNDDKKPKRLRGASFKGVWGAFKEKVATEPKQVQEPIPRKKITDPTLTSSSCDAVTTMNDRVGSGLRLVPSSQQTANLPHDAPPPRVVPQLDLPFAPNTVPPRPGSPLETSLSQSNFNLPPSKPYKTANISKAGMGLPPLPSINFPEDTDKRASIDAQRGSSAESTSWKHYTFRDS